MVFIFRNAAKDDYSILWSGELVGGRAATNETDVTLGDGGSRPPLVAVNQPIVGVVTSSDWHRSDATPSRQLLVDTRKTFARSQLRHKPTALKNWFEIT